MGKQRHFLELHHMGDDAVALCVGVHRVENVAGVGLEPAHVRHRAVAAHHADVGALLRLPRQGRFALHGPLHAAGGREDGEDHMLIGGDEVMHHARKGRIEALRTGEDAVGIHRLVAHAGAERAGNHVAEKQHLAGLRVNLRMGRHRPLELVVIAPGSLRLQGAGVDLEGRMPLLQGQQLATVPNHVGVGEALVFRSLGERVVLHWIERAVEAAALTPLQGPLGGAHPAVAVAHPAVLNVEHVQHAVARKPVVVAARRKLRIGAVAEVGNVEVGRQLTANDHVVDVALHANRREIASQLGVVGIGGGHKCSCSIAGRGRDCTRYGIGGVRRSLARSVGLP